VAWFVQCSQRMRASWQRQKAFLKGAGGAPSVETVDAVIGAIVGEAGGVAGGEPRRARTGEQRLALDLIQEAVRESMGVRGRTRDDARAWLRNALALMSARLCFEALDMDYEAALSKLEAQWSAKP
jgi:hypothetical protein